MDFAILKATTSVTRYKTDRSNDAHLWYLWEHVIFAPGSGEEKYLMISGFSPLAPDG